MDQPRDEAPNREVGPSEEVPRPRGQSPPVADPAEALSPTARRLLAAARRVLARDGFAGLTLEAITAEAGENKASVRYHFGSKDALIATLVEWLDHDDSVRLLRPLSAEEGRRERLDLLLRLQREGCSAQEENQLFFELLPHMLREPGMRARLGDLYQWYRDVDRWVLAPDADERDKVAAERLAALVIAVGDGLTLQCAADPLFDVDGVYTVWERMLRLAIDELRVAGSDEKA